LKEIAEDFIGNVEGYKEYFAPGNWMMDNEPFTTAVESFQSLLKSLNITGMVAIIKEPG
jgi:hypothetical protein